MEQVLTERRGCELRQPRACARRHDMTCLLNDRHQYRHNLLLAGSLSSFNKSRSIAVSANSVSLVMRQAVAVPLQRR
jgi:hypothetical protein